MSLAGPHCTARRTETHRAEFTAVIFSGNLEEVSVDSRGEVTRFREVTEQVHGTGLIARANVSKMDGHSARIKLLPVFVQNHVP